MAVHVAAHFQVAVRIAEQAVGLAAGHEPIDRFADAVGVFAVADRAAFHEHRHAGEAGHCHRVESAVRFPVAVAVLDLGEIVEAFANDLAVLRRHVLGTGVAGAEKDNRRNGGDEPFHRGHPFV